MSDNFATTGAQMITKPLHVATVGNNQLRFFRTPNDDGRPNFPWHAVDDLQQCLGLDRRAREIIIQSISSRMRGGETVQSSWLCRQRILRKWKAP
jgi:hypothetical protein